MTILPFPIRQHLTMDQAWAIAADRALQSYAGWLFHDSYGDPDVPGWLGDEWRGCVLGYRSAPGAPSNASDVDWPMVWGRYVDLWLAARPEWRERVEAKLAEMEEVA